MRFTVRSLALVSVTGLALVGLTVPAASAATGISSAPTYGATSTTEIVSGTSLHSGDTISLSMTSGSSTSAIRTVTADSSGTWSYTFAAADVRALPDGTVTVNASEAYCSGLFGWTSSDTSNCPVLSGATSSTSSKTFAKDTYVPPAPSLAAVGSNFVINSANQTGVTATGQVEANSTVTLKLGTITQTATANSAGLWSMFFDASGLADGNYTATATEAEAGAAHNVGPAATKPIVKDTVAATKTASSPAAGSTVGSPAKVSFTFSKPLADGSITLKNSGGTAIGCSATPSGNTISCAPASALTTGNYTATASVTDMHSNPATASISFTVDATAPVVSNLKSTNTTASTANTTVTGSLSKAATLTITSTDKNHAKVSQKVSKPAGNFSVSYAESSLTGGPITVSVTAVDVYGNSSTTTTMHTRTAPPVTSISLSVPGWSAVGSPITLSGVVHLATPGAYGSVTLVHANRGGKQQILTTTRVSGTGAYSYRYTPGSSGTYYAIYNAVSGAGAQSPTYSSQLRYAISGSAATGAHTTAAVIGGAVHNPPIGTIVTIYKLSGTTWVKIGAAKVDRTRHYRFSVVLPKGSTKIRATIPGSGGFYGNSATFTASRT